MKKAVILLSGGLDSSTVLAVAQQTGFDCYPLSFDYGQKHRSELEAAKRIVSHFQIPAHRHKTFTFPAHFFQKSALTDPHCEVQNFDNGSEIPSTYVPARNTIFLSIALGYAEMLCAADLFIGVSCVDYSGYPDCRPAFIAAFENLANLATKAGVEGHPYKIHTPLLHLSKAQTIQLGQRLGVDYSLTVSCYRATIEGRACGTCDSCTYRKKGFEEAGVADVTLYV